jgi:hypothetical protein
MDKISYNEINWTVSGKSEQLSQIEPILENTVKAYRGKNVKLNMQCGKKFFKQISRSSFLPSHWKITSEKIFKIHKPNRWMISMNKKELTEKIFGKIKKRIKSFLLNSPFIPIYFYSDKLIQIRTKEDINTILEVPPLLEHSSEPFSLAYQ